MSPRYPDPSGLALYKVADTDAALAAVTRLGGTVLQEAMDTPTGGWPRPPARPRRPWRGPGCA